jgi:hypothetical protein
VLATVAGSVLALSMAGCPADPTDRGSSPAGGSGATAPGPTDAAPAIARDVLDAAAPTGRDLGPGWSGPIETKAEFTRIATLISGCRAHDEVVIEHEAAKPRTGTAARYERSDPVAGLTVTVGVDTIARNTAYLEFIRTVPTRCPTSGAGENPMKISAGPPHGLGEDEASLHFVVEVPDHPFGIDLGFVRVGGLVVSCYALSDNLDPCLRSSLTSARAALTGKVTGV